MNILENLFTWLGVRYERSEYAPQAVLLREYRLLLTIIVVNATLLMTTKFVIMKYKLVKRRIICH